MNQYKRKYTNENRRQSKLLLLISNIFAVNFVNGEKSIATKPGIIVIKNIATNINGTFTYSLPFGPIKIITPVIAVISPPINSSFVPSNISEIFSTVIFILPLFTIGKFLMMISFTNGKSPVDSHHTGLSTEIFRLLRYYLPPSARLCNLILVLIITPYIYTA